MDTNIVQDLLIAYLSTYNYNVDHVNTSDHKASTLGLDYKSIRFNYYGTKAEIRIYNPSFIKVRVLNTPGMVCDNLVSAKDAIDRLPRRYMG